MRRILALILSLFATPVAAQTLVTSDRIDDVSVTLYRDPARGDGDIRRGWPGGYALITETRTIDLPAGPAVVRFEGVSQGMMPESAIVTGLPRPVDEKNRDARLLSPASLVDAYLKRRVTLRRTNRATGRTIVTEAVIQAGPRGGVVLTTDQGVEALGCSGLPEGLSYPGVPADLSAKPTLSIITNTTGAARVTVQLSYLSQGFDWSADYVALIDAGGKTMTLFAWATIANGGSMGFADARTQAVAGEPNKERDRPLPRGAAPELYLQCWPMDTTSTHPEREGGGPPPPPPPPPPAPAMAMMEDIVVSGSRRSRMEMAAPVAVMVAQQEELGDLKLYRIPEPVTVAALSRKQVAMVNQAKVRFARVYTGNFDAPTNGARPESEESQLVLRAGNVSGDGLGLPLPAGRVAVFEPSAAGPLLIGESRLTDRAIGDEVELTPGSSSDVRYTIAPRPSSKTRRPYRVEVTNARATAETFELALPYKLASVSAKLVERKGVRTWRVTVPANGEARLDFAVQLER